MYLRIIGGIVIIFGVLGIVVGVESIITQTGHDLSSCLYDGLYLVIAGIGLFLLKRWGIILSCLPLLYFAYLELNMFLDDEINVKFRFSVILLLFYALFVVSTFSQWRKCTWK